MGQPFRAGIDGRAHRLRRERRVLRPRTGAVPRTGYPGPTPESGSRRHRPLPYRPHGNATVDHATVRVTLTNTGTAAVSFLGYANTEPFLARPVLVAPGHDGHLDWPVVGRYDVIVYGPSGFVRSFTGTAGTRVTVTASYDGQALRLALANPGADAVSWPTRDGWYDVTVHVTSDPTLAWRFAGRIER